MRAIAATVVMFIAVSTAAPTTAADWQSQYINDHLKGRVGVGTLVGGTLKGDRGTQAGVLRAYCADNSTVVNVQSDSVFFGSSEVTVRYRLDEGPVQTARWDPCRNGRCVGLWGGQGIPFLKSLYGKKELRIVIELRFTSPLNATFNVDGAEPALAWISTERSSTNTGLT